MNRKTTSLVFALIFLASIFIYSPQSAFGSVSCNYHDFGNQGPSPYTYTMRGVNAVTVGEHQGVGSVNFFVSVDGGIQTQIGTKQVIGAGTDGFEYNITLTNDTDKKKRFTVTLYCQHSDGTIETTFHYAYAEAAKSEPAPEPEPILEPEPEPQPEPQPEPEKPAEQPEAVDQAPAETPKATPEPEQAEAPASFDPSTAFTMTRVQGEVEYRQDDGSWISVAAGDHIPPNALIRTKDGIATIRFTDGSTLDIGRNTQINLDLSTPHEKSFFEAFVELNAGQIRAKILRDIKNTYFKLRVRTRVHVATIRGTEFVAAYDPEENISTTYLKEGSLDITPSATGDTGTSFAQVKITVDESGTIESVFLPSFEWDALIADEFSFEGASEAQNADAGRNIPYILWALLLVPVIAVLYWALRRKGRK